MSDDIKEIKEKELTCPVGLHGQVEERLTAVEGDIRDRKTERRTLYFVIGTVIALSAFFTWAVDKLFH